jgi:ribose 5-phosphate isomerase RpiB
MNGLNQILKIGWIIVNSDSSTADHRLRALGLINDLYKYLMELTTNGVIVTDAIRYVQSKMDHLNTAEKKLLQNIKEDKDKEDDSYGVCACLKGKGMGRWPNTFITIMPLQFESYVL